jgi:hypothetical protein
MKRSRRLRTVAAVLLALGGFQARANGATTADQSSSVMPILQLGVGAVFGRPDDPSTYLTGRVGALLLKSRYQMWGAAAMVDRVAPGQWQLGAYGTFESEGLLGSPFFLEVGAQRRFGADSGTFVRAQAGLAALIFPLFIEGQRGVGRDEWLAVAGVRLDLALLGLLAVYVATHGQRDDQFGRSR